MLGGPAPDVAFTHTDVSGRARASNGIEHEKRLQALLTDAIAVEGGDLQVAVTQSCGAVEVRVSGPTGELRLPFDRAHLHPSYVLGVVRETVRRYRTSLGCRPYENGLMRRERT